MNEPTTQRKAVGPGVLGAIAVGMAIIAGVVIWLSLGGRERTDRTAITPANTSPATVPTAVTDFLNYQQANRAEAEMAEDHSYTSDGLRRLAAALESLGDRDAVRGAEFGQQLARVRQQADNIQADPHAATHAASIRAAFTTAADLMSTLQRQHYPNLDAQTAQLRRAAEAVDPAQLTLLQKTQVGAFFAQAGVMLRAMTEARG